MTNARISYGKLSVPVHLVRGERLLAADPSRWRRIDAARPPEAVHADVLAEVEAARSGATV